MTVNAAAKTMRAGFALAAAALVAAGAQAAISVEARSVSLSQSGPQPVGSYALSQNGVVPTGGSNVAGPNGSSSAGPVGTGVTSAFADTTQISGAILTTTLANADLATGRLSVHAEAGAGVSQAYGLPKWTETITFNNTSGAPVELDFFWDTDGSVADSSGPALGSIDIQSSIVVNIVNDANYKEVHLKGGPAFYMGGAQFIYSGQSGSGFAFQPSGNNMFGAWTTTAVGDFSGLIKATLVLPDGVVSISIVTLLSVDCRYSVVCDYAPGATFSFGPLPAGLTWTSESGVFLSAAPSGSTDTDGDGTPDAQDECPNNELLTEAGPCGCDGADTDGDGACNDVDNCPEASNADQADADEDERGDACDNCPEAANADQADGDEDDIGDACEEPDDNDNDNGNGNANGNDNGNANGNGNDNANDNSDGGMNGGASGGCGPAAMLALTLVGFALMLMQRRAAMQQM